MKHVSCSLLKKEKVQCKDSKTRMNKIGTKCKRYHNFLRVFFSYTGIFILHVSLQIMSQFLIPFFCFLNYFRYVLFSPIYTCIKSFRPVLSSPGHNKKQILFLIKKKLFENCSFRPVLIKFACFQCKNKTRANISLCTVFCLKGIHV